MEKIDFVFLIDAETGWNNLLSHIANLKKVPDQTGNIAVVAIGAALLTCLQRTDKKAAQQAICALSGEGVQFYLCINTMKRYGITEDMLLPGIEVAAEGGLMKTARLEVRGYHKFQIV